MKHPTGLTLLVTAGLGSLLLSGCSQIVSRTLTAAIKTKEPESSSTFSAPPSPSWEDEDTYIKSFKPVKSGPGIAVFEPVAKGQNKQMVHFGAGCARWLHLQVGGQSALGKTPLWGQLEDARIQVKSASLRLDAAKARELAKTLGVTHVAVGEIEPLGSTPAASNYRLRYRLLTVSDGKPVGQPLVLEGSATKLIAELPATARQMAARLGVSAPKVAGSARVSAPEMTLLGQVPWKSFYFPLSAQQVAALRHIAAREPLAGLLYQRSGTFITRERWQPVIKQMFAHSPENAMLLADLGWRFAPLTDEQEAKLKSQSVKHPNNFLLAIARMTRHRGRRERAEEQKAAEQAVRSSPQNSLGWAELGTSFSNQASDVRRARFSSQLSRTEASYIYALYPRALAAHTQAARVNPSSGQVWADLARAATFAGEDALADKALWKAIALDPGCRAAYDWGFEMYQSKWGGNKKQLLKLAETAVANGDRMLCPSRDMVDALRADNMADEVERLLVKAVAKNPRDYEALYELGALAHYQERSYRKAEKLYRQAIAASPDYDLALSSLGDLHEHVKRDSPGAEKLYRKAIAIDPDSGYYRANLAACLHTQGRREEAMAEAGQAMKLGYKDAGHTMWGRLGLTPP